MHLVGLTHVWKRLCFPCARHQAYGGVKVELHSFSTSALEEDERSVSRPWPFTYAGRAPDTEWVDPKAGLNILEKIQIICPCGESKQVPADS